MRANILMVYFTSFDLVNFNMMTLLIVSARQGHQMTKKLAYHNSQSLEWKSPLYVNFIDYEKAFDS